MKKVILFNLGGPKDVQSIRKFLFNLFYDKNIIDLPLVPRWFLAHLISSLRYKKLIPSYQKMGGQSPIFKNTQNQADALQKLLPENYEVIIAMRYSQPYIKNIVTKLNENDEVVLLPLYPQFSTTTTGSFFEEWDRYCKLKVRKINSYYLNQNFIRAHLDLLQKTFNEVLKDGFKNEEIRFLFSAHGLPKKIIEQKNDPYVSQIQESCHKIATEFMLQNAIKIDYQICYQSRVGPVEWVKPYTDDLIKQAGKDGKVIIISPIAFVSEHIETLIELDEEYYHLAQKFGVKKYYRISTLSCNQHYIDCLKELVINTTL